MDGKSKWGGGATHWAVIQKARITRPPGSLGGQPRLKEPEPEDSFWECRNVAVPDGRVAGAGTGWDSSAELAQQGFRVKYNEDRGATTRADV